MEYDRLSVPGRDGTRYELYRTDKRWYPRGGEGIGAPFDAVCDALLAARREWVPFAERHPAPNEVVILWHKSGSATGAALSDGTWDYAIADGFTHWMPLPSPPKGDTP